MCGITSPSQSPAQNQAAGNANAGITSESAAGSQLNSQLQGILGGVSGNSISDPSGINAGYSNFGATGGISPTQVSALSDQASEAAQSGYSAANQTAQQQTAATGGYGDIGAISSSLGRAGSNAASTAAVNSGASITGLQTSNELAGLGGQAGLYNTNVSQIQQLINSILSNQSITNTGVNSLIGTKAGLANNPTTPSLASTIGGGLAGAVGALP
jgi:hypothetical protein